MMTKKLIAYSLIALVAMGARAGVGQYDATTVKSIGASRTVRGIFAYGLDLEYDAATDEFTFIFGSNMEASSGKIHFYNPDGSLLGSLNIPSSVTINRTRQDLPNGRGAEGSTNYIPPFNRVTFSNSQIPGYSDNARKDLTWAVELTATSDVPNTGTRLNCDNEKYRNENYCYDAAVLDGTPTYCRLMIAVDNSPESDYFGYVYVNNNQDNTSDVNLMFGQGVSRWVQGYYDTSDADTGKTFNEWMRSSWRPDDNYDYSTYQGHNNTNAYRWGAQTSTVQGHYATYTQAAITYNGSRTTTNRDALNTAMTALKADMNSSATALDIRTPRFTYRGTGSNGTFNGCFRDNMGIAVDYLGNVYVGDCGDYYSDWINGSGARPGAGIAGGITIFNPELTDADGMGHYHDADPQRFYFGQDKSVANAIASSVTVNTTSGLWSTASDGKMYGGSVGGVAVTGSGENTYLCATQRDFGVGNSSSRSGDIAIYKIGSSGLTGTDSDKGQLKRFWGASDGYPTTMLAVGLASANNGIARHRRLQGDSKGGLWISTHRNTTSDADQTQPALMYATSAQLQSATNFNEAGRITTSNIAFNSARDMGSTTGLYGLPGGGFAVSPDNNYLAAACNDGNIYIYLVRWNGDTPWLTYVTKFAHGGTKNTVWQMAFDWGNNLYVGVTTATTTDEYNGTGTKDVQTFTVFSLNDGSGNTHVTPAKKRLVIPRYETHATAVYLLKDKKTVVVKQRHSDGTRSAADIKTMPSGKTDYMAAQDGGYSLQGGRDYDHSYWGLIEFPSALSSADQAYFNLNIGSKTNEIKQTLGQLQDVSITSFNTQTYPQTVRPAFTKFTTNSGTDAAQGISYSAQDNLYNPNNYITLHFMPEAAYSQTPYWFEEPANYEYATISWAVYDSQNQAFYVPSTSWYNIQAGFKVNLKWLETVYAFNSTNTSNNDFLNPNTATVKYDLTSTNTEGKSPSTYFTNNEAYTFRALLVKETPPSSYSGAPAKVGHNTGAYSTTWTVYPIAAHQVSSGTITGIKDVEIDEAAAKQVKQVTYYNVTGSQLREAPDAGFFIEMIEYTDGTRTSKKRLAR